MQCESPPSPRSIVMVFYVVAAIVLNLIVTNHLISTTDNRLADRLEDARQHTLPLSGSSADDDDRDADDVPVFLWSIAPSGTVTALTSTAPPLPARHWGPDPVTLDVGSSAFRFDTLRVARCRAGGRSEHGRDVERPVDAPSGRARLRSDPGCRRVRWCDGCGSAGLRAVGARPSPAGRFHRRCLARAAHAHLGH